MKSKFVLDIVVDDEQWIESVDFDVIKTAEALKELTFDYVANACEGGLLSVESTLFDADKTFEVGICLSNDDEVQELNKKFRGIDRPTNVLSFANIDDEAFFEELGSGETAELGSIILAYETLSRESAVKNITIYAHYCHLLVHGFLHLLGFDHQEDREAEEMEGLETEILAAFSIEDPYFDTEDEAL